MLKLSTSTQAQREAEIKRSWHLIDMKGQILGRIAPGIAKFLQGKQKAAYSSHLDNGDYVVVINASAVQVTGKKRRDKIYTSYSGYPGGLRQQTLQELLTAKPEEVIRRAVSGMLPKNKLRDRRLARLFIFKDSKHPYQDKFTS